jgi:acyl carrier protein
MDDHAKFQSTVATILGLRDEQVADDLTPDLVDTWDSLNHINLIAALEQEFAVTFPTENLADSMSVGALKRLLSDRGISL